jgi:outer membrane protein OmpA-like peptidoglycan-associated protein
MNPRTAFVTAAAALLLAACAANPPANSALEQARTAVNAAQSDPQVTSLATGELDLAQRTLNDAERLAREGKPAEVVSHRAYIAEQRARIARESAEARAAEADAEKARAARRAELEQRAKEAELARERAEALARESQQKLQAIEQARESQQAQRLAETEQLGAEMRGLQTQLPELRARETARGWELAIVPGVLFEPGEANLSNSGRRALDNVARVLRRHPERNILVEGFADEAGGQDLNRHLAERRAHSVRNALVLAGLDGQRIVARAAQAPAEPRVQIVVAPEPVAAAGGSAGSK